MRRARRRSQVHFTYRGGLNRKGRKRMRAAPDFGELDDFMREWRRDAR